MAESKPGASRQTAVPNNTAPVVDPAASLDLTDRQLGEFKLLRKLGKGGMAEVYLAEQTTLRRQVAVKVLRPEFLTDDSYVKRFRHEAAAAGGLSHPNIVQVYLIGQQDGIEFIAQEYVQGRNLRDFMKKKGPLDAPIAMHILKQVAAALQVAGQAGIVHRDIKPENIMLTRKGEAKVADFGLAQLTLHGERVALTQAGVTMGTPLYMSPEQVGGKPVDHRSDLYSFGVMAYHMLSGRPPFTGETALSIAVQHMNETPQPLAEMRPDLPPALCDLVRRLMAKKKEDRPADALAVLNELKRILRQTVGKETDEDAAIEFSNSRPSLRAALLRRPLKKQVGWMALACALTACASAGAGWLMRTPDPLLTPAAARPAARQVPAFDSIQQQVFHAMSLGDDRDAWLAVLNHADAESHSATRNLARLRLAIIDLRNDRVEDAEQVFQEFVNSGGSWEVAHGNAGLAYVAFLRGDRAEANRLADRARTYADGLNNELLNLMRDLQGPRRGP